MGITSRSVWLKHGLHFNTTLFLLSSVLHSYDHVHCHLGTVENELAHNQRNEQLRFLFYPHTQQILLTSRGEFKTRNFQTQTRLWSNESEARPKTLYTFLYSLIRHTIFRSGKSGRLLSKKNLSLKSSNL